LSDHRGLRIAALGAGADALSMRLRAQDGFTLPEVMFALAILPFVLVALLKALDTGAQLGPRSVQYASAVHDAGSGVSRAIRDVRQAYRIVGTTPNAITFLAVINGTDTQVNISCDVASPAGAPSGTGYRRCVRTTAATGAVLPSPVTGTVLVDRVINGTLADPVFDYTPTAIAPTFVGMTVRVPSQGEGKAGFTHPITIDNGTLLRNNVLGS
jgi:prepilin-type N-terminal cleavage/methylation domain-containing protein